MAVVKESTLAQFDQLNVLIIDGDLQVHDILKKSLYRLGVKEVHCAENTYKALKICDEMQFHIIVCAFDVKSDKDGFHLFEELKFKGHITKATIVIFLSAEIAQSLVNSIIELQPDDFWVKPLDVQKVQTRLKSVLKVKQMLLNVCGAVDKKAHAQAIYFADRHLMNDKLASFHPNINRIKGEAYIQLKEYQEAESLYKQLLKQYQYSWVYLGYAKVLLKQGRVEEINFMLKTLTNRSETRFGAYDMMAQHYIEHDQYQQAYEQIKKATILAPKNIERNKKLWQLARLTHDHKGQYMASRIIAQQAKNSIYDSPEFLLNAIRSGIDFSCTIPDDGAQTVLKQTDLYIEQFESDYDGIQEFEQQLLVVKARLHNVRNEEAEAAKLVKHHITFQPTDIIEDNLDKVKVLHEVGMGKDAIDLLKAINGQFFGDTLSCQVIKRYIEQETQERAEIKHTAKQLNTMAVEHFQKNRLLPALDAIMQALQLSPGNNKLMISQLKILITIRQQEAATSEHIVLVEDLFSHFARTTSEGKIPTVLKELTLKWQKLCA